MFEVREVIDARKMKRDARAFLLMSIRTTSLTLNLRILNAEALPAFPAPYNPNHNSIRDSFM